MHCALYVFYEANKDDYYYYLLVTIKTLITIQIGTGNVANQSINTDIYIPIIKSIMVIH